MAAVGRSRQADLFIVGAALTCLRARLNEYNVAEVFDGPSALLTR